MQALCHTYITPCGKPAEIGQRNEYCNYQHELQYCKKLYYYYIILLNIIVKWVKYGIVYSCTPADFMARVCSPSSKLYISCGLHYFSFCFLQKSSQPWFEKCHLVPVMCYCRCPRKLASVEVHEVTYPDSSNNNQLELECGTWIYNNHFKVWGGLTERMKCGLLCLIMLLLTKTQTCIIFQCPSCPECAHEIHIKSTRVVRRPWTVFTSGSFYHIYTTFG